MDNGWIKIHRIFLDWEWFEDPKMVQLFLFLLLKANHQDNLWRGTLVKRGQLVTGLYSLKKELKMSFQSLRTCLAKLEKTGEINKQTNNHFSVITICKYDNYQASKHPTNTPANKPLTNHQQTTNNKQEYKNVKKEEKEEAQPPPFSVSDLKKNPQYSHIDVDLEFIKMDSWLSTHPKSKKTKSFILNWLNRIEVPIESNPGDDFKTFCKQQGVEP